MTSLRDRPLVAAMVATAIREDRWPVEAWVPGCEHGWLVVGRGCLEQWAQWHGTGWARARNPGPYVRRILEEVERDG
jgi:hypothetical protein